MCYMWVNKISLPGALYFCTQPSPVTSLKQSVEKQDTNETQLTFRFGQCALWIHIVVMHFEEEGLLCYPCKE